MEIIVPYIISEYSNLDILIHLKWLYLKMIVKSNMATKNQHETNVFWPVVFSTSEIIGTGI